MSSSLDDNSFSCKSKVKGEIMGSKTIGCVYDLPKK